MRLADAAVAAAALRARLTEDPPSGAVVEVSGDESATGWAAAPKDDRLQSLIRAPDKVSVVLVRVKPRGGAPPPHQRRGGREGGRRDRRG